MQPALTIRLFSVNENKFNMEWNVRVSFESLTRYVPRVIFIGPSLSESRKEQQTKRCRFILKPINGKITEARCH